MTNRSSSTTQRMASTTEAPSVEGTILSDNHHQHESRENEDEQLQALSKAQLSVSEGYCSDEPDEDEMLEALIRSEMGEDQHEAK